MAASIPTRTACALIRRSRATHYRHQQPPILGPRKPRTIPDNGQALTAAERAHVLTVINSDKYSDLAICQIYARELDDGNYWCSTSSMYRIASEAGQNRERRRLATHPAKVKPELPRRRAVTGVDLGYHQAPRTDEGRPGFTCTC